LFVACALAVFG
jgi:hypothetical protein